MGVMGAISLNGHAWAVVYRTDEGVETCRLFSDEVEARHFYGRVIPAGGRLYVSPVKPGGKAAQRRAPTKPKPALTAKLA